MPTSRVKAIFAGKCPRCRSGEVFVSPPYHLGSFARMHVTCPHCGLRFEREPGTFFAAMYITYGFNVAILVACGLATLVLLHNPDTWVYISIALSVMLVLYPLNFRFSRILWLYASGIRYEPSLDKA
jgi:uncharacterized protein (DUF983 family)